MSNEPLPASTKHAPSFSLANKLRRVLWGFAWNLLFRFTPPPLWAWRRFVLRAFGARIGKRVRVYGSVRIWLPANLEMGDGAVLGRGCYCYNQGRITIGPETTVSWGVTLCSSTHDFEDPAFPLVTRPIEIGSNAWIAAEAFVGPGVRIGDGAVLGARAVAMQDLEGGNIYSGNPAVMRTPRRNETLGQFAPGSLPRSG